MIFIQGGVRSGKSTFGEKVAEHIIEQEPVQTVKTSESSADRLIYIATGIASDKEMKERIRHHQFERRERKGQWRTWEKPAQLYTLFPHIKQTDVLFLDCLTVWLANEKYGSNKPIEEKKLIESMKNTIRGLKQRAHTLIIISNDIFSGGLPDNKEVKTYVRMLGHLHQLIVSEANIAVQMESGIPIVKKGEKPQREWINDLGYQF